MTSSTNTYINKENIQSAPFAQGMVKGLNGIKNFLLKYIGVGTLAYAAMGEIGQKAFNAAIGNLSIDIATLSSAQICETAARALITINSFCPALVIATPIMIAGGAVTFAVKAIKKAKSKKGKVSEAKKVKSR